MKHILDQSDQSQTQTALRHVYAGEKAKRPSAATLQLQKRALQRKTPASKTQAFVSIERDGGV